MINVVISPFPNRRKQALPAGSVCSDQIGRVVSLLSVPKMLLIPWPQCGNPLRLQCSTYGLLFSPTRAIHPCSTRFRAALLPATHTHVMLDFWNLDEGHGRTIKPLCCTRSLFSLGFAIPEDTPDSLQNFRASTEPRSVASASMAFSIVQGLNPLY